MFVVPVTGMNDQTGLFIDHQQVLILIHDVQRDIFRCDGVVMRFMIQQHLNDIAGFDAIIGSDGATVHPHITSIRSRLDAVTARVGHMLCQVLVNALFALTLIHLTSPTLPYFFVF